MCKSLQDVWWTRVFSCTWQDRSNEFFTGNYEIWGRSGTSLAFVHLEKARETCGKMADQRRFVCRVFFIIFKYCNTAVVVMRQLRVLWKLRWILSSKCINDCKCSENWLQMPCWSYRVVKAWSFQFLFRHFFSSELVIGFHRRNPCYELFYHYSLEDFLLLLFQVFYRHVSLILSRKQLLLFCIIIACLNLLQIAEKMILKISYAYTSFLSSSELMMLVCLFWIYQEVINNDNSNNKWLKKCSSSLHHHSPCYHHNWCHWCAFLEFRANLY